MKKIRLVHIISNLSLGGAQILLFEILNYLKKQNDFDIKVISIDSGEFIQLYRDNGLEIIDLNEKGLLNPKIFTKLKKALNDLNPDIVHTHLNKADFYGRLAAKHTGVKHIISTCHNYSSHHGGADIDKKSFFDRIDNSVIRYTDCYIIAISEIVEKFLLNRDKKFCDRVKVIYNGINTEKQKYVTNQEKRRELRKKLNIKEDDIVILISGRLEKQKGQIFFIKTLESIFKEKKNIRLLILGEGNLRDEISNLINELDLTDYVKLLGFKKRTEEYIEISDLIAVPSLWEGFGLVILEGMVKGKPVLASDAGGIPEIIQNEFNGFLFKTGNMDSLKNKFNSVYERLNDIEQIKENALDTVLNKFSITRNSEEYRKFYYKKLGK